MKHTFLDRSKALMTAAIFAGCSFLWLKGFLISPLWLPELRNERDFLKKYIVNNSVDYSHEKKLAEAYWLRYKDVRDDPYWGKNGPQTIWGPRDHYRLLGKKEGRVFGALPQVESIKKEEELAKAYWQRYPDIAEGVIWGKKSQLGILGPRDHYHYVGRWQGRVWAINQKK